MKPALPAESALVGRDSEITQLLRHFDAASNGRGTTVFISGEAGVGKTRLVNEFLVRARKKGAEVLCGWCLSEAAIPYFPFTEAFNTYVSVTGDAKAKSAVTKQLGIVGWLKGTELTKESKTQELFSTPEIERARALAKDSLIISEKAGAKKYIAKGLKLKAEILAKTDNTQEAIELMQNALKFAQEVGNPPLLWQTHYSLGLMLERQGSRQKANEHHSQAIALVEETASKLKDASLRNTLLTSPRTKTIGDALARTKPTP